MMAPMEVPATTSTGMRSRSSTLSTPTWARPRAPPPESTRPTFSPTFSAATPAWAAASSAARTMSLRTVVELLDQAFDGALHDAGVVQRRDEAVGQQLLERAAGHGVALLRILAD